MKDVREQKTKGWRERKGEVQMCEGKMREDQREKQNGELFSLGVKTTD